MRGRYFPGIRFDFFATLLVFLSLMRQAERGLRTDDRVVHLRRDGDIL
jgi:hypothetical protein